MWILPSWVVDIISKLFSRALEEYGLGHVLFVVFIIFLLYRLDREHRKLIRAKDEEIKRLVEERGFYQAQFVKNHRHSALTDKGTPQEKRKK